MITRQTLRQENAEKGHFDAEKFQKPDRCRHRLDDRGGSGVGAADPIAGLLLR
jgi:hypothetical protein